MLTSHEKGGDCARTLNPRELLEFMCKSAVHACRYRFFWGPIATQRLKFGAMPQV